MSDFMRIFGIVSAVVAYLGLVAWFVGTAVEYGTWWRGVVAALLAVFAFTCEIYILSH